MDQSDLIPSTLPKIDLSKYELASSQAEVALSRKIFLYKRKGDQRKFRAISISDKTNFAAFVLFLTRISASSGASFLKFIGWAKVNENINEPQTHLFFFENFDTTLKTHIKAHSLTNMEVEDLFCSLLDSIDSLEQFAPTVFPCWAPESIVTVHTDGKRSFKILDMYIYDKAESSINFDLAKWASPELYQGTYFEKSKYSSVSRREALIYTASYIVLHASTGINYTDARKKITNSTDFEANLLEETYAQATSLKDMGTRMHYDQDSIFCHIIEAGLKPVSERITLDEAKELLKELGHSPIDWPSFEEERQVLSPSRANSMLHSSFDRSFSRLVSLTKKRVSQYELISTGKYYNKYRDNSSNRILSGLDYTLVASDNNPSHDPFIIQLTRQNNLECSGLLKYEGYFYKTQDSPDVVLLFEEHQGTASEFFSQKRIEPPQIIELCSTVAAWLDYLHVNKSFLPSYITPKNVVVTSSNPLTFKLAGLKLGLDAGLNDWMWLSPEHYCRVKGSSGELILDKPLVYSMNLVFLEVILTWAPAEYRLRLREQDSTKIQSVEVQKLTAAMDDLKNVFGEKLKDSSSKEVTLYNAIKDSLKIESAQRSGLFGWTHALPSSAVGPIGNQKEHVLDLSRSMMKVEKERRFDLREFCSEPKNLCDDWFNDCWALYGIFCGLIVSTFIIMMSFVAS